MIRTALPVAALVLASGCASTGEPAALQSRTTGNSVTINCSGANSDWVFCYRNANEVCGLSGFSVISRDGVAGTDQRRMVIACK